MGNPKKNYPMERFYYFVQTILKKKAIENSQEIYFESPWIEAGKKTVSKFRGKEVGSHHYFDAIAPNGFEQLQGHVIFEIKSRFQKNESLNKAIEELYKKIQYNAGTDRKIHIFCVLRTGCQTLDLLHPKMQAAHSFRMLNGKPSAADFFRFAHILP